MADAAPVQAPGHRAWLAAQAFVRGVSRAVWRLRVEGADKVPREGGLIIASNHVSFVDPPMVGASVPRVVFFLAKEELLGKPFFGGFIRSLHALPIRRGELRPDQHERIVSLLGSGHCLLMFPEGTRSRTGRPGRPRSGVALFARDAAVPVIPAHIDGARGWTTGWLRGRRITVRFGDPVPPPPREAGREEIREAAEEIMRRILSLGPA